MLRHTGGARCENIVLGAKRQCAVLGAASRHAGSEEPVRERGKEGQVLRAEPPTAGEERLKVKEES